MYHILGGFPIKQCMRQRLVCYVTLLRVQIQGVIVRKGEVGAVRQGRNKCCPTEEAKWSARTPSMSHVLMLWDHSQKSWLSGQSLEEEGEGRTIIYSVVLSPIDQGLPHMVLPALQFWGAQVEGQTIPRSPRTQHRKCLCLRGCVQWTGCPCRADR